MDILSQRSSVCSVERLRSFYGRVWGDSRASLGAKKARGIVLTGSNIRLKNQLLAIDLEGGMPTTPTQKCWTGSNFGFEKPSRGRQTCFIRTMLSWPREKHVPCETTEHEKGAYAGEVRARGDSREVQNPLSTGKARDSRERVRRTCPRQRSVSREKPGPKKG
jgi:hypothetical protein